MPFSVDDKHLIKVFRDEKHYTAREFLKRISEQEMVSWWFKSLAGKNRQIWLR